MSAIPLMSAITLIAVTGCSGSGSGGTGLQTALARVADTAGNRSQITYDNTAELVRLAGSDPASTKGFALLRGLGVPAIASTGYVLPGDAGFNLYAEDYSISAGTLPRTLSLMAGGQNGSQITSHLTSLGWKRSGGKLVGPPPLAANSDATQLAEMASQVLPAGSDVVFGSAGADLSQIGSPQGATLASDPGISALAQCLGNVVAAELISGGYLGGAKPAAIAVGISQPASGTATPRAVVCVNWPSQAAAARYATAVRRALSSGFSLDLDTPYSALVKDATVTAIGGGQNTVQWQADTPQSAQTVLQMVDDIGLPALQDCAKLTALQAAEIPGCP
jgi:hypothetical protein